MPTTKKTINQDWISLTEAAGILGVHPSTVRNWSDSGALPVYRTTGAHRRYKRSEVELWSQSRRQEHPVAPVELMKAAVRQIRVQVAEGRLEEEAWYLKLDEEARSQYRLSGGVLARGLMNFLTEENDGESDEARSLGYEYASRAKRYELNSAEATRAFLFFRNMLFEAVMRQLADSNISSKDAWHLLSRVIAFTDQIQLALLETFLSYENPRL